MATLRLKPRKETRLSQMLKRKRDGQRPMPTGGRKAKTYRGRKRNEFFGRIPRGNTNPDNRFPVRT